MQLSGENRLGLFGVHNGGASVAMRSLTGLELQERLVAPPGAVGQRQDCLAAPLQGQTRGLQAHVVDEMSIGVVTHRGGVSADRD